MSVREKGGLDLAETRRGLGERRRELTAQEIGGKEYDRRGSRGDFRGRAERLKCGRRRQRFRRAGAARTRGIRLPQKVPVPPCVYHRTVQAVGGVTMTDAY